MAFTNDWTEVPPTDDTFGYDLDDYIRNLRIDARERAGVQHVTYDDDEGKTDVWEHKPGECNVLFVGAKADFPTPTTANAGCIAIATDEANKPYYWSGSAWTTCALALLGAANTFAENQTFTKGIVANNTYIQARNEADDDNVDLVKAGRNEADDADVAVLSDAVRTETDAAPVEDTGVSNKKYVDDHDKFIQRVYTQTGAVASGSTGIPLDDTIPQNTEGDEYMTLAITPTSATNILVISAIANIGINITDMAIMALFQDSTAGALAAQSMYIVATSVDTINLTHSMVAGTTSETTFKIRIGSGASRTVTFNGTGGSRRFGGVAASGLSITEYKP